MNGLTVYVESNFVLELAYLQESHTSCIDLLELAENDKINLVIPAFCLAEPMHAIVAREKLRVAFQRDFLTTFRELSRSHPYTDMRQTSIDMSQVLVASAREERLRLRTVLSRIANAARIIPILGNLLSAAFDVEDRLGLSRQDAVVYASVVSDCTAAPRTESCFLTRNSRDFETTVIKDELAAIGCKLLVKFDDGFNYASSRLGA